MSLRMMLFLYASADCYARFSDWFFSKFFKKASFESKIFIFSGLDLMYADHSAVSLKSLQIPVFLTA